MSELRRLTRSPRVLLIGLELHRPLAPRACGRTAPAACAPDVQGIIVGIREARNGAESGNLRTCGRCWPRGII